MELSIDTSTRIASVSLSRKGKMFSQISWESEQNHSIELVPAIRGLIERNSVSIDGLKLISVASGPGGFSALRVGMSTAKGLSQSLGIPIIAIPTLDLEAEPFRSLGLPVCSVIRSGKSRIYFAVFDSSDPIEYRVSEISEFPEMIPRKLILCGEGIELVSDEVLKKCGDGVKISKLHNPSSRVYSLSKIGYKRYLERDFDNIDKLAPIYLRRSHLANAQKNIKGVK